MPRRKWDWNTLALPAGLAEKIQPYTKSSPARMQAMYNCLHTVDVENIPGVIVECGVWRGGNIMLARMVSPGRICWLYDTFDGMTEPDPKLDVKTRYDERAIDRYNRMQADGRKWNAAPFDEVVDSFEHFGLMERTEWIVGPVENSLRESTDLPDAIAVLRLDLDWHSPTKMALRILFPRLSNGGFLIVDDYGHWLGCQKAVNEYFDELLPPRYEVDYSCVVFRKC
jgi:O-methyltransferase